MQVFRYDWQWPSVIRAWFQYCHITVSGGQTEILTSCLWENKTILILEGMSNDRILKKKKLVGETWRTSGILKVLNFRWPFEVGRNAKVSFSEWKRCPHKDRSYSKQRTYTHTNRRTHSAVHKDGEDLLQTTSHKTQTPEFIISCLMRHHYC